MTNYIHRHTTRCNSLEKTMRAGKPSSFFAAIAGVAFLHAAHADVGRTVGEFDVSASGAASYSIPIWTPPGPKGVAPTISLEYNSQADNGVLGVGWTLAGLSSIERCPSTAAQDGASREVRLDTSDKFCLDGMRLRKTGSIAYGNVDSTYQTEFADFSETRLTSAPSGIGAEAFEVRTKDGLTRKYGTTANSRVKSPDAPASYRWKVDTVTDRNGNSYTVEYTDANAVGHKVPSLIRWTRENSNSTNYIYSMAFEYEARPAHEGTAGYVGGYFVSNSNRLKAIRVNHIEAGSTKLVRKYVLEYDTGPTTLLSRLTSVKECADEAASNCLSPTLMAYQPGPGLAAARSAATVSNATLQGIGDFDGDGKDDLAYTASGQWNVLFGANGAFGSPVPVTGLTAAAQNVEIDNFMPNGRSVFIASIGGTLRTFRAIDSNGDGIQEFSSGLTDIPFNTSSVPTGSDVNGDGLSDLLWATFAQPPGQSAIRYRLNTTTATSVNPTFGPETIGLFLPATTPEVNSGRVAGIEVRTGRHRNRANYNGDQAEDVFLIIGVVYGTTNPVGVGYMALLNGATGLAPFSMWRNAASQPVTTIGDFNDDNCTDMLNVRVLVSKCNNLLPSEIILPAASGSWVDWDGDGRVDYMVDNGGMLGYYRSTGSGFGPLQTTTFPWGFSFVDFDGDKLPDLVRVNGTSLDYRTRANGSGTATVYLTHLPDLLSSVTDGYGVQALLDYVSTAQNNYLPGTEPIVQPLQKSEPSVVVGRARHTDGVGGTFSKTYTYVGGRRDMNRSADVGFEEFHETDSRTQFVTKTFFEQLAPSAGSVKKVEVLQPNGRPVSRTTFTNTATELTNNTPGEQRHYRYVSKSIAEDFDLIGPVSGATPLTTVTVEAQDVDTAYGNVGKTIRSTKDNDSNSPDFDKTLIVSATHSFEPANLTTWCIGLVNRIQDEFASAGETTISRVTILTPDTTKCRPTHEHIQTTNARYDVHTDYFYDAFGNMNEQWVVGKKPDGLDMARRVSKTTWDDTGTHPKTQVNAAGESTTFEINYDFGLVKQSSAPNNEITKTEYDAFGRQSKVIHPDNTATEWDLAACGSSCFGAEHKSTVTLSKLNVGGGARSSQTTYLDRFDRPIVVIAPLLSGGAQWAERQYDVSGELTKEGLPCIQFSATVSCTSDWVEQRYDDYGRIVEKSRPMSAGMSERPKWTYSYVGRKVTVIDPAQKSHAEVMGINGRVRLTTDANEYSQTFAYNVAGDLLRVSDAAKTLFSATYEYGRSAFQITNFNPARGTVTNTFNSLGERVGWQDAKNTHFTAEFDALSRPTLQSDVDNTSTFEWGAWSSTANDVGRIKKTTSSAGGVYTEEFFYDSIGRPAKRDIKVTGEPAFSYDYTYDATTGLLDTLSYPTTTAGNRLVLKYGYTNGSLSSIGRANTSQVVWTADSVNVRGQVTAETLGQNIHSSSGIKRELGFRPITGLPDTMKTGTASNTSEFQDASYFYDVMGNLTQRQNNKTSISEDFYYGSSTDNLYRLEHSSITGGPTPGTNLALTYDAIGNIVTQTEAGISEGLTNYSITWNNANYPTRIQTSNETFEFSYGPLMDRWKTRFSAGGLVETTLHLGEFMEKVAVDGASTRYVHYVSAGGVPIAQYTRTSANDEFWRFILSDHQGTIDTLVAASGETTRMSFTAFGDRRGQATWSGRLTSAQTAALDAVTRQGYTYHTALGSLGMNHMNGRVQDARTGRFLSPDPIISDATNSQDFNRYNYVYNNPLTLTDPSGFCEDTDYCPPVDPWGCNSGFVLGCQDPRYPRPGSPPGPSGPRVTVLINGGQVGDSTARWGAMSFFPGYQNPCNPYLGCNPIDRSRPMTPEEAEEAKRAYDDIIHDMWIMIPGIGIGDCIGRTINEAGGTTEGKGCDGWAWSVSVVGTAGPWIGKGGKYVRELWKYRNSPNPKYIRQLKDLADGAKLTSRQIKELGKNIDAVLERSLPGKVASGRVGDIVKVFNEDPRFRFIDQVPGAAQKITDALKKHGVTWP
jgi:RHS repeat-associated protein